jgi:hypothetical protein
MNVFRHLATTVALITILVLALIPVCEQTTCSDEKPTIEVKLHKDKDTSIIQQEAGRTVIVVTTETGIGRMTLSAKEGIWPKEVTIRLRYNQPKAFKTLEGFQMTSSRLQVRTNSGDSGKVPFFLATEDGKYERDDLNPSGWLKVDFKPHGDDLDVVFPSQLWRGEKEVHFQWIDFYRT